MAEATNTFSDGMNRDIPDMQMPSSAYTAALNATLITDDGNEGIMLNDMGNAKIYYKNKDNTTLEVTLEHGFIPIGVKSFGEILYIASVKNDNGKLIGLIGTFPSPDYTIDKDTNNYKYKTGLLLYVYKPLNNLYKDSYKIDELVRDSKLLPFTTEYLNFDLTHAVDILVLPSYDGSVNLLLTDNKNRPRLINSAFAVREGNSYEITKHIGDNNTNIYNAGEEIDFLLGIALQKQTFKIPKIEFLGLSSGGQLLTGGYVIYIKASDEDGNMTDIVAESGVIPVFFGEDGNVLSTNGGYANMRTDKLIRLKISNMDLVYSHVSVYFSRTSSAVHESATTTCHRIGTLYPLVNGEAYINITGFETFVDAAESEINTRYFIIDKNRTLTTCQDTTFIGNVKGAKLDYEYLRNLSLHIYPSLKEVNFEDLEDPITGENLNKINLDTFTGSGYTSSRNVYYFTGYHNEEIYRFGVVYIFSDGSRSNVYNTLGINELRKEGISLTLQNTLSDASTEYVNYPDDTDYIKRFGKVDIEKHSINRRGACRVFGSWNPWTVRSIEFNVSDDVLKELKKNGIIGLFFVRLKRVPLRLLLAFTTPILENTFTPAIKYGPGLYCNANFPPLAAGNNTGGLSKDYFPNYLVETFYKNVYDKTNRDFDVGKEGLNPKDRFKNKELRVFFPKIGEFQNTRGKACKNMWWNLTLDYNERLLPLTNYGLVYSNKTYTEKDDKDLNSSSVNGPYPTYDGKFPKWTGSLPVTQLLQLGAYACFSPEFELDLPYYNSFFTGLDFNIKIIKYENVEESLSNNKFNPVLNRSSVSERVYYDRTNNYKVKKAVKSTNDEHDEYFKVKLISVEDGVSLLGIQRDYNKDNECKEAVISNSDNQVIERPYWKYRDTVYFSSKVGDATDKLRFKETGGERVATFSPLFKYKSETDCKFYGCDGELLNNRKDIILYDNDSNGGQSMDEIDNSSDDAANGGGDNIHKLLLQKDEWFAYPYNLEGAPTNLVRGLYSPYIGLYISNSQLERFYSDSTKIGNNSKHFINTLRRSVLENSIINIYIPGFSESKINEYFTVVMLDKLSYYCICDAINLESITNNKVECFRGDCYSSACSHRINRNFQDSTMPSNDTIVASGSFNHYADGTDIKAMHYYGDADDNGKERTTLPVNPSILNTETKPSTDANKKNKLNVNLTNLGDLNAVLLGSWINFNLSTTMNIALRSEDRTFPTEKILMGQYRSFYPLYGVNIGGSGKLPDSTVYNKGFSISGGVRKYTLNDNESYDNTYYKNRIYYSNVEVKNEINNGMRTILSNTFQDYDLKFGSIVKLYDLNSNLLCIMEHGCAVILVKPRAVLSGTTSTYINTANILDDRLTLIITDSYGTTWEDALVETPTGIYGIDTFAKKIWAIVGGLFTIISDGNIASFLNDNLNITNESLEVGKLKIKGHYNLGKKDVIFTCYRYDKEEDNNNVLWSICWNETFKKWITFYSWIPELSANIGNTFLTFDHKKCRDIILNNTLDKVHIWKHGPSNFILNTDKLKPTNWYGLTLPFEIEFIVALSLENHKLFTNLKILSNKAEPESFHYQIVGLCYENVLDKPTQYYRLERTNELWHRAGSDISFDPNYKDFYILQRPLWHYEDSKLKVSNENIYVKSLVPWNYYVKTHNANDIENYYIQQTEASKDYNYLVGAELVRDDRLMNLCLQTHAKGVDIDGPAGVLRGNMKYMEDVWYVQISPVWYKEKNEALWQFPPILFNNTPIPEDILESKLNTAALEMNLTLSDFDFSDWGERKSFKLKDKYIKIRIRYSGRDKVIIQAVKTLYQVSYA